MKRGERGANLVEFALALFFLIPLMVGLGDIGRAFHSYMIATNAAREGARAAARMSCYNDNDKEGFSYATQRAEYLDRIREAVMNELEGTALDPDAATDPGDIAIDLSLSELPWPDPLSECPTGGESIRVTVSFPYTLVAGQILGMGNSFTIVTSAAMSRTGVTPTPTP